MANLLTETLESIKAAELTPADVSWVGSRDGSIGSDWAAFTELARDFDYHDGYGAVEVPADLVVVFTNGRGWLERETYDGSEGWMHKKRPILRSCHKTLTTLRKSEDVVDNYLVPPEW